MEKWRAALASFWFRANRAALVGIRRAADGQTGMSGRRGSGRSRRWWSTSHLTGRSAQRSSTAAAGGVAVRPGSPAWPPYVALLCSVAAGRG